jgi:hypothetical protein
VHQSLKIPILLLFYFTNRYKMANVTLLQSPPPKLEEAQKTLFSKGATDFIETLHKKFDNKIEQLYKDRLRRTLNTRLHATLDFKSSPERLDKTWNIAPLPTRLQ